MKNKTCLLPVILAVVLFVALLTGMLVQIFLPAAILPAISIPNIVLLSLVALLLERWISKDSPRCYVCVVMFGVVAFGVLPLMAGFTCVHEFWKIGLVGGITFASTTCLCTSATKRLKTGPKAPAALLVTCLGIYLAAQCFAGILL